MFPYTHSSYKTVLKEAVFNGRARSDGIRPTFQAMAAHCRVQKTYLSKVLNHDGHLSEDQLFLALEYLELEEEARDFTLLLMAHEKSMVPARSQRLEAEIKSIRARKLKTEANLKLATQEISTADLTTYYLDPVLQVIHMMLTIKRFASVPEDVGVALHLSPQALARKLRQLEEMGLIKIHLSQDRRGRMGRAEVLRDNLHLPQDSPLHPSYSARMRLKAIERMDQLETEDAFRFSVVFSTNPKVREKIHASFMDWLKNVQKLVQSGKEEEVYQMNFDLFRWT